MKDCSELEQIVVQNYHKDGLEGGAAEVIQSTYSTRDGMLVIGTAPQEWYADQRGIARFFAPSGVGRLMVKVQDIRAYSEGDFGWTADQVQLELPYGQVLPVRHTKVFLREEGAWKIVHLHVSVGVKDDALSGLEFPEGRELLDEKKLADLEAGIGPQGLVLKHYQDLESGSPLDFAQSLFSNKEPVVVIGSQPGDWHAGYQEVLKFFAAEGGAGLTIRVEEMCSMIGSDQGWVADRVRVRLPGWQEIPVRHTYLFTREAEGWKMVHAHISVPVSNEQLDKVSIKM